MSSAFRRTAIPLAVFGLVASALPASASARAQDSASGSEGALFLLLPVGAKSIAMARAATATRGAESVWWNPAGLAGESESRIDIFRGEDLAGDATAISGLIGDASLGTLGLSYMLFDGGTQDFRDAQGNFLGKASYRNHLGVLSAASEVLPHLALGLNFKVIQSRFACRGQCIDAGITATTWAVDMGAQWRDVLSLPVTLGAALVHLGGDLQVFNEEQADPLPTRVRLAVAWDVLRHWVETDELHGVLTVELEDRWRDPGSPATYVGAELSAGGTEQAIFVRAGYAFGAQLQVDGAGVGVGIRYDRFDLGIAKSLASSSLVGDTEPVQISLGFIL